MGLSHEEMIQYHWDCLQDPLWRELYGHVHEEPSENEDEEKREEE
jgi:hypothetical protein